MKGWNTKSGSLGWCFTPFPRNYIFRLHVSFRGCNFLFQFNWVIFRWTILIFQAVAFFFSGQCLFIIPTFFKSNCQSSYGGKYHGIFHLPMLFRDTKFFSRFKAFNTPLPNHPPQTFFCVSVFKPAKVAMQISNQESADCQYLPPW